MRFLASEGIARSLGSRMLCCRSQVDEGSAAAAAAASNERHSTHYDPDHDDDCDFRPRLLLLLLLLRPLMPVPHFSRRLSSFLPFICAVARPLQSRGREKEICNEIRCQLFHVLSITGSMHLTLCAREGRRVSEWREREAKITRFSLSFHSG